MRWWTASESHGRLCPLCSRVEVAGRLCPPLCSRMEVSILRLLRSPCPPVPLYTVTTLLYCTGGLSVNPIVLYCDKCIRLKHFQSSGVCVVVCSSRSRRGSRPRALYCLYSKQRALEACTRSIFLARSRDSLLPSRTHLKHLTLSRLIRALDRPKHITTTAQKCLTFYYYALFIFNDQ